MRATRDVGDKLEVRDDDPVVSVVLWWIPVGAGGHLVAHTSGWWEWAQARLDRRPPQQLLHAGLEVTVDRAHYVIEMAPAWAASPHLDRGVVCTGPVGLVLLGRLRFFRYEVRCWRDGIIPDVQWAVDDPITLAHSPTTARALLEHVARVPTLPWGRTVGTTGDMWNSNSVVSWLLATAGIDTIDLHPPPGGRAPGWEAGLAVARPSNTSASTAVTARQTLPHDEAPHV